MIKFGDKDCMTTDYFLPENNEKTTQEIITDTTPSTITQEFNKEIAANLSNATISIDNSDCDLDLSEEEQEFRFREGIRLAKEKSRIMGKTTCEYDREKGKPYLLYPDGHREYRD